MELFIEAVRQYPFLWDTNHKDYRHGDKKDMVWKKIADLNIPEITDIKTAKSVWKKLRDNHRDSLKRQKSGKTGQAAPTANTWKYGEIMEFLIPYMKNRERSTNLSTQDISDQQAMQGSSYEERNQQYTEVPLADEEGLCISVPLEYVVEESESTPQAKRKRKNDDDILDIIREMENNHNRRQEERDNMRRQVRQKHPMELFFESMAETAKKMPTYLQNKIKQQVLQSVCDAEEEFETYHIVSPASA